MKKIGFIFALNCEAEGLLNILSIKENFEMGGKKILKGNFKNFEIYIAISGVGKVNMAIASTIMQTFDIDLFINAGLCGSIYKCLKPGNVVFAEKSIQYDFSLDDIDKNGIGKLDEFKDAYLPSTEKYFRLLSGEFLMANLGTADKFSNKKSFARLLKKLGGHIRDMEGASFAQTILNFKKDFIILKCVANYAGKNADKQYYKNKELALKNLTDGVIRLLELLED